MAISSTVSSVREAIGNPTYINVADYGAVGDGVTDDSTAVQAAFTAAPAGATIVFPGKHLIENISVTKSVRIVGGGPDATLYQDTPGSRLFQIEGSNIDIRIQDLIGTCRGGWANTSGDAIKGLSGTGCRFTMRGCSFTDFSSAFFSGSTTWDLVDVQDSKFYYTHGRASICNANVSYDHPATAILGGGTTTIIRGNYYDGLVDPTFTGVDPAAPTSLHTPSDGIYKTGGTAPDDYLIQNNVVNNCGIEGILVERIPQGAANCIISGNTVRGSSTKGEFFGTTLKGIYVANIVGATVIGNVISDVFEGIGIDGSDRDTNTVTIAGNTISNVGLGIRAADISNDSVIENNTIHCSSSFRKNMTSFFPTAYTQLSGIFAPRGWVRNNTLLLEEPDWDGEYTLSSRASNVFTLADATGVTSAGIFVSYQDGKVAWLPVDSVAGNDVTISNDWAVAAPHVTTGTLYYVGLQPDSFFLVGGIISLGETGDILRSSGNVIQGALNDHLYSGNGEIVASGNILKGVRTLPLFANITRIGPQTRDDVQTFEDDIEITDDTKGLILASPDGTRWRCTVDNTGTLVITSL